MYPTPAAAAIETMAEADRWERFAALEAERFARYGEPPAEAGLPWGPDAELSAWWAEESDAIEAGWDMAEAFGEPPAWAEYDAYADSLAGRYERAEVDEMGSQVGHGDW